MRKPLDRFEAGFDRVMVFLASLAAASIGLFAILIPLDLLLRILGWGNMWWLYEGIEYTLYVGVFIAAPWVLRQGAHVRVDVLVSNLPRAVAARMEQALNVAGAVISGALCYYGALIMVADIAENSIPDKLLIIPNAWMMAVFSLAFLMLVIEFLLRIRRAGEALDQEETAKTEAGF
jgi:TRAP-type C4-dicarboxylate transport system permease small subunit